MCLYETCIFLIFSFIGACLCDLQISPSNEDAERYVNESYAVTCHGEGALGIAWRGPGKKPIPPSAGRIHTEERETGLVSLVFESIHRSDKGAYTCTATIGNKQKNISFNLTVVRPIKFISGLLEQNLTDHSNGLIRCEATGEPKPTILWTVNGKSPEGPRYATRENGLYIMNVTKEDEGTYLCRAFQVTSQTSTLRDQPIEVSVHYKPQWTGRQLGWYGYIGGVANLTCEVDAKPSAVFEWTRIDQNLENPTIITEINRSILQINVTDESVFGKYECKAKNSAGNISRIGEFKEGKKPEPPTKVMIDQSDSADSVQVRAIWSTTDEDLLGVRVEYQEHKDTKVTWEHPEFQDLYLEDEGPLTLRNLKPNTDYVMRVATLGLAGLSDYAEEMKFITSGVAPSFSISAILICFFLFINRLIL